MGGTVLTCGGRPGAILLALVAVVSVTVHPARSEPASATAVVGSVSPGYPPVAPRFVEAAAASQLPRLVPLTAPLRYGTGHALREGAVLREGAGDGVKSVRRDEEGRFHFGKRALLSAALAASSGVIAWVAKREADDSYERYLRAAGSDRQQEQFDRAERYDRISGAAFAAMEAGILMTAYFTFF